jgi:hypothetical protein
MGSVKGTGAVQVTETVIVGGNAQVTESVQVTQPGHVTEPARVADTLAAAPLSESSAALPDSVAAPAPNDSASGTITRTGRVRYTPSKRRAAGSGATAQQQQDALPACDRRDDDDANPYMLRIAWPALEYDRSLSGSISARADADSVSVQPLLHANVSSAVTADFDSQRAALLARTILRAATKLSLTRTAEKSAGKKNEETVGRVLGALTNLGGVLTERADTRSWHLLPGSLSIVRLRVPAGAQRVTLQVGGGYDSIHSVELPVHVRAGGIGFTSARVWR